MRAAVECSRHWVRLVEANASSCVCITKPKRVSARGSSARGGNNKRLIVPGASIGKANPLMSKKPVHPRVVGSGCRVGCPQPRPKITSLDALGTRTLKPVRCRQIQDAPKETSTSWGCQWATDRWAVAKVDIAWSPPLRRSSGPPPTTENGRPPEDAPLRQLAVVAALLETTQVDNPWTRRNGGQRLVAWVVKSGTTSRVGVTLLPLGTRLESTREPATGRGPGSSRC